ncbi:MAG: hypothetical protein JW982_11495 [Spirochaetes bacterium]|nr:hypothetical protein [Spirochaetota bacterium]
MKKLIILAVIPAVFLFCGKADRSGAPEQKPEMEISKNADSPVLEAFEKQEDLLKKDVNKSSEENIKISEGIKTPYYSDFPAASSRMLEYKLNLQYDSSDILKSRQILLYLTGKYGYIKSGTTSADSDYPYFNSVIMIKTENLIEAMKEFNALGVLKNEVIEVIDHTPDKIRNEIQQQRGFQRIKRRAAYTDRASTANRNFSDIEQSLASSEDTLDEAKFTSWLIEDKITWATVSISITGPLPDSGITIPDFKKAFIILADFMLNLVYASIILIPLWLIIIVILIKKQWFKKVFLSKVKK